MTVSNLSNRLESFIYGTYTGTKENYETWRKLHLPQKLKFRKEQKFRSNTVSE